MVVWLWSLYGSRAVYAMDHNCDYALCNLIIMVVLYDIEGARREENIGIMGGFI